jgi:hypothetical protein
MAVVYNMNVKNARMIIVRDAIDVGSGPGKLQIGNAGFVNVLAELTLQDPSGAVTSGVLAFTPPTLLANGLLSGTAAEARIRDSNSVVVVSGLTVGTTGTDILLNSTTIIAGEPVEITSASISHG